MDETNATLGKKAAIQCANAKTKSNAYIMTIGIW